MRKLSWLLILAIFIISFGQEEYETEKEIDVEFGVTAVGGKLGLLFLEAKYGITPGFGIWLDFLKFGESVTLDAGFEFWNGGKPDRGFIKRKSNMVLYVTAKVGIDYDKFTPFLGGGLGYNMYREKPPEEWPSEIVVKQNKLELHIDMGTRYYLNEKIDLEGRFKINISDVSSYGLYATFLLKLPKK
jgi:hypothetical protein